MASAPEKIQHDLPPTEHLCLQEETLVASWLSQKKPETTGRNYTREVRNFFKMFPGLGLKGIEVGHIAMFLKSRSELSPASKKKSRDAIGSLLTFCVRVGYLPRNPALALDRVRPADKTSFRILTEDQVKRLIQSEPNKRDQTILKLLYSSGVRVSELCGLCWRNFALRTVGVQMTIVGKGGTTRSILLSETLWSELETLKKTGHSDEAVFRSQKEPYNSIQPNQVRRIVARAAKRAGLSGNVSPHWLRHCHATHALERGAPIHILQKTLGHASLTTTGKYLTARPLDSSSNYLSL